MSSDSATTTSDLEHLLERGLFIDNLHQMTRCCTALARNVKEPLPYFVLASVFSDLAANWDGRPLSVEEAVEMEQRIGPDLRRIIIILTETGSADELLSSLNTLVQKFVRSPI